MIDYINGKLAECTATYAVIDCGGVGYMLNISLGTYTTINGQETTRLFVYEAIREDAFVLYGFATQEERAMFKLLVSVSGVGPNTARVILSAYPTSELRKAIMLEDVKAIKSIKGIGQKSAERLIVELKDKVDKLELGEESPEGQLFATPNNKVREDSLAALEALGYARAQASKVVDKLLKDTPDAKVEQIVKGAFKLL